MSCAAGIKGQEQWGGAGEVGQGQLGFVARHSLPTPHALTLIPPLHACPDHAVSSTCRAPCAPIDPSICPLISLHGPSPADCMECLYTAAELHVLPYERMLNSASHGDSRGHQASQNAFNGPHVFLYTLRTAAYLPQCLNSLSHRLHVHCTVSHCLCSCCGQHAIRTLTVAWFQTHRLNAPIALQAMGSVAVALMKVRHVLVYLRGCRIADQ